MQVARWVPFASIGATFALAYLLWTGATSQRAYCAEFGIGAQAISLSTADIAAGQAQAIVLGAAPTVLFWVGFFVGSGRLEIPGSMSFWTAMLAVMVASGFIVLFDVGPLALRTRVLYLGFGWALLALALEGSVVLAEQRANLSRGLIHLLALAYALYFIVWFYPANAAGIAQDAAAEGLSPLGDDLPSVAIRAIEDEAPAAFAAKVVDGADGRAFVILDDGSVRVVDLATHSIARVRD